MVATWSAVSAVLTATSIALSQDSANQLSTCSTLLPSNSATVSCGCTPSPRRPPATRAVRSRSWA